MKKMLLFAALVAFLEFNAFAQGDQSGVAPEIHRNAAIISVSRTGAITNRQALVLERAKAAPGDYDLEFIGDSITQHWEDRGANVWRELGRHYKTINLGVSGDRTEHVLWRFEQGQLDGIKAKVAVVLIGTNNSIKNKDGTDAYTDADILAGVIAVVDQLRVRQPETKILLLGIFPRGKDFNSQRGRLLEVNQVLAKLNDGEHIFYLDFGSLYLKPDGTIASELLPDALHPNEAGYQIWAQAMQPKLDELLGGK